MALSFAYAGANSVAPSDLSDGRIRSIKLSSSKPSSQAKRPSWRAQPNAQAASTAPSGKLLLEPRPDEHKRYLLPPPARKLAQKAMLPCVCGYISDAKGLARVPVVAMQVSGVFAMLHAAASAGVFELKTIAFETTEVIVRARASAILSYLRRNF
ncbi:hypothetical protein BDV12DRAFT_194132 [Aspergillus spectabilis]